MRRTLFTILISAALLLTLSVCPFALAESYPTPELERILPSSGYFVELNNPIMSSSDGDTIYIVDKLIEEASESNNWQIKVSYMLYAYKDGKMINSFDTGSTLPLDLEVYDDFAFFLMKDADKLTVFDLTTKEEIELSSLPTLVRGFEISDDMLYVHADSNLKVYDLSEVKADNVTLSAVYTPESFFDTTTFTVFDGTVYYEDTITTTNTQTVYVFDTKSESPASTVLLEDITRESGEVTVFCTSLSTDGNYLYMFYSSLSTKSLSAYSFTTAANKIPSPFYTHNATNVHVCGNKLFVTSNKYKTVDIYKHESGIWTYVESICSSNEFLPDRFYMPTSVYNHIDNTIIVADNKAIGYIRLYNATTLKQERELAFFRPLDAVGTLNRGYVSTSNSIHFYLGYDAYEYTEFDGKDFSSISNLVMDKNGIVYFIDKGNDRVISANTPNDQTTFSLFDIDTPVALSIAPAGDIIYAIYTDKICAYDSEANELFSTSITALLNGPLTNVYDVDSDVKGNLFILSNSDLIIFNRTWQGYELRSKTTLTMNGSKVYCKSITVDSQGEVLLSGGREACVYRLKNAGASKYDPADYVLPEFNQKVSLSSPAQFVKINEGGGYVFNYKTHYENARAVAENTTLLLIFNQPIDGMYYVYYDGRAGFLPVEYATVHQATVNKYRAMALYDSPVYKYPIKDDEFVIDLFPKDMRFEVQSDVFGYYSKTETKNVYWYQIEINDEIYYIERYAVGETEIEVNKDYGKAKLRASAINTMVSLYNRPKADKAYVIDNYKDGTEIQFLEEFTTEKEFIHVSIDGVDGYVLSSEVNMGGMTPAQIVLLILVVLGGAASCIILVMSRKTYRKR